MSNSLGRAENKRLQKALRATIRKMERDQAEYKTAIKVFARESHRELQMSASQDKKRPAGNKSAQYRAQKPVRNKWTFAPKERVHPIVKIAPYQRRTKESIIAAQVDHVMTMLGFDSTTEKAINMKKQAIDSFC